MKKAAESKNYISGLMALTVLGIFAVCVLAVLFAGTRSYSNLTAMDRQAYETRTCTGYIAAKVRQAAEGDNIAVENFGGSPALVIGETIDEEEYKTLIYCYDGWLMEYFADAEAVDMTADMEFGSRLFPAEKLELSLEGALLYAQVTMDGKPVPLTLAVRSGEEASYEK